MHTNTRATCFKIVMVDMRQFLFKLTTIVPCSCDKSRKITISAVRVGYEDIPL